jgi:hypothetical protein
MDQQTRTLVAPKGVPSLAEVPSWVEYGLSIMDGGPSGVVGLRPVDPPTGPKGRWNEPGPKGATGGGVAPWWDWWPTIGKPPYERPGLLLTSQDRPSKMGSIGYIDV